MCVCVCKHLQSLQTANFLLEILKRGHVKYHVHQSQPSPSPVRCVVSEYNTVYDWLLSALWTSKTVCSLCIRATRESSLLQDNDRPSAAVWRNTSLCWQRWSRWSVGFEERQWVLKEFNIRASQRLWGVSEGIVGRGCSGPGFQMWVLWSCTPPPPTLLSGSERWKPLPPLLSFCAAEAGSDKPLGRIHVV